VPVVSYLPTEILDYLGTHQSEEGSTFGIGQRELAKALGYHPCSVSRPLATLVHRGDLLVRRAPVRGGIRRQLVYALTESGRIHLQRKEHEVPLLSSALPPPPNPFVGRREELREISAVGTSGGVILHLQGASGMGKSALVARAMRRLKAGRIPFWFPVRPASSPRHFTLSLAHALASTGSRQLAYYAQLPKEPNGREVADLVRRALGDLPLLGVLDDAQMASGDFRAFFAEFAPYLVQADRADFIVVISQEPTFLPADNVRLRTIRLDGIDRTAAHELTDRRGGLGERFEAVFHASGGNPLLLQLAISAPDAAVSAVSLPAAVVARLSELDVEGLLPASVSNEPVPVTFMQEAGGLAPDRVQELIARGLVQRASEGRVEVLQAVRAAIVARVAPSQVRAAHLEMARFYGRSHRTEAVRERFLHLIAGEGWRLAGELVNRQENALLASGYSDALRSALRQLTLSSPVENMRVRALRVEAQLLRVHSEFTEAISCLRRAAAESNRDPRMRAECLLSTVELHARQQQTLEAERAIAEARRVVPATRRLNVFLLHCEARVEEMHGNLPKAREMFSQAFQLARKSGQGDLALEALARWSRLASMTARHEGVEPLIETGIPEARESGRMDIVFNLMSVRARNFVEDGQADLAIAEMNKIRAEAEALGYLSQLVYALSGLAALATELKRWEESMGYAQQAAALSERLGNDLILGHTLAIQCASELRQNMIPEARHHGERAVAVLSRLTPSDSLPVAHAYLAEVFLAVPDLPQATHHYQEALRLADSLGMAWWRQRMAAELGPKLTPDDVIVGTGDSATGTA
jgi:tetratricopeptide (TPR) repeat protein/DNA-binding MarR family transcriptional regulator